MITELPQPNLFDVCIGVSHGMAYQKVQDQLNDVTLGAFDLDGEMVQKTYGVLFLITRDIIQDLL